MKLTESSSTGWKGSEHGRSVMSKREKSMIMLGSRQRTDWIEPFTLQSMGDVRVQVETEGKFWRKKIGPADRKETRGLIRRPVAHS